MSSASRDRSVRSPPGLGASQSQGRANRAAPRRSPPASRDVRARAPRHASPSPRRSTSAPPGAPPRPLTCTPRWAAGPGSGGHAAAPASAPCPTSPAATSSSEAAPAASWRRRRWQGPRAGPRRRDADDGAGRRLPPTASAAPERQLPELEGCGGVAVRRPRHGGCAAGPSLEGALWSPPRGWPPAPSQAAQGLAIDDSARNGATCEREERTAQAPGGSRAPVSPPFLRFRCARSSQVCLGDVNAEMDVPDDAPHLSARPRCA